MTEESPVQPRGRDHVPRDDLREIIEAWREAAVDARRSGRVDDAQVLGSCADELEVLLDT